MTLPLLSVSFLAGTCLLYLLPQLPSGLLLLVLLVAGGLIFIRCKSHLSAILFFVIAGMAWAAVASEARVARQLDFEQGRLEIELDARIVGVIRQSDAGLAFRVSAALQPATQPVVLDLRWYDFPVGQQWPVPGERWRLLTRLRAPRGFANPGARYRADYALRSGIAGLGYILAGEKIPTDKVAAPITRLRNHLSQALASATPESSGIPLVIALAVGDRQHLSEQHWAVLRNTGLSHVIAISGMHIAIVSGLFYLVGGLVGSFFGQRLLLACLLSAVMACAYAALAGFTIPTQRALIVVFILLASRLRRRQSGSLHALSLALLLVVMRDPWCALDYGFWLSFGAVAVIAYVNAGRSRAGQWTAAIRMQGAIVIGLCPLLLLLFGQVSLAAPVVNIVLLPLFSLLLVPGTLLGVVVWILQEDSGAIILGQVGDILDYLWPVLVYVADIPAVSYRSATPSVLTSALAIFATAWLLAPGGWPARGLGILCLLPAFFYTPAAPLPGSFVVQVLDVGQGLAVVVRTQRHWLVFDSGPGWRNGGDAGSRIVIPFLQRVGAEKIDRMIISHGDNDHAGGLDAILLQFDAVPVLASQVAQQPECHSNQKWFWDGVSFELLHPAAADGLAGNNASCVLRISNSKACALLTGDIEAEAERTLVARSAEQIDCDLVLAPHHGSETSSTQQFVTAVQARVVVVSSGYANPWGFPRPKVVRRWQRAGALVLNTADTGAITAAFDPAGHLSISTQRCQQKRFWRVTRGCSPLDDFRTAFGSDHL